jgi:hypothetical protein
LALAEAACARVLAPVSAVRWTPPESANRTASLAARARVHRRHEPTLRGEGWGTRKDKNSPSPPIAQCWPHGPRKARNWVPAPAHADRRALGTPGFGMTDRLNAQKLDFVSRRKVILLVDVSPKEVDFCAPQRGPVLVGSSNSAKGKNETKGRAWSANMAHSTRLVN